MADDPPLILLSGMGADERLFNAQREAFPNLVAVRWIEPRPEESLRQYAARLAQSIDPGRPCFIGGASFGGMVAREMAPCLQTIGRFLIASLRSPYELPWRWRFLWPVAKLGPDLLRIGAQAGARIAKPFLPRATLRRLGHLGRPEMRFLRWACCAVLNWRPLPADPSIPVFQIHGDFDHTLPIGLTRPDVIVPGGGHLLPITHPDAVNKFLRDGMASVIENIATI